MNKDELRKTLHEKTKNVRNPVKFMWIWMRAFKKMCEPCRLIAEQKVRLKQEIKTEDFCEQCQTKLLKILNKSRRYT